ncbi:MAG: DMT family transporter [Rhodobacteraceae bacterium]|nr:DMT family transporter [Paracoccaceae bacterium]
MFRSKSYPIGLTILAAVLWGLWWLPIRHLNTLGIEGGWSGFLINGVAALLLLPVLLWRREMSRMSGISLGGAILIGAGVNLYAFALSYTDVVRAALLFYLTPAWSTAIECLFMGRRWNALSLVAFSLSIGGLVAILGEDIGAAHFRPGDLMALASGIFWSIGTALVFSARRIAPFATATVCMLSSTMIGATAILILGGAVGELPNRETFMAAVPTLLLLSCFYMLPMIVITTWSSAVVAPALLGFLLSFEILSAVGSSALVLDEPFGLREIVGTILVGLGAMTEFLMSGRVRKKLPGDRS